MSWSVNAKGTAADVKAELDRQFAGPLAAAPAGLTDEGERETVRRVRDTVYQCIETFDPEKTIAVSANGHMGFDKFDRKVGAYQQVSVSIQPGS